MRELTEDARSWREVGMEMSAGCERWMDGGEGGREEYWKVAKHIGRH